MTYYCVVLLMLYSVGFLIALFDGNQDRFGVNLISILVILPLMVESSSGGNEILLCQ